MCCFNDIAAIHQNRGSLHYIYIYIHFLSRPPLLCTPSPQFLSVNTTLQLFTLNSEGHKDQAWPSHLQRYSLERKADTHKHRKARPLSRCETRTDRPKRSVRAQQTYYLIFLGLDKQFGGGDARLVRRNLILEGGKKKKGQCHQPLQRVFTQATTNIVLPLSDNNSIQFQGAKCSAAIWLLISVKVSAGCVQINLLVKIRAVTVESLGFFHQIIPPNPSVSTFVQFLER